MQIYNMKLERHENGQKYHKFCLSRKWMHNYAHIYSELCVISNFAAFWSYLKLALMDCACPCCVAQLNRLTSSLTVSDRGVLCITSYPTVLLPVVLEADLQQGREE